MSAQSRIHFVNNNYDKKYQLATLFPHNKNKTKTK